MIIAVWAARTAVKVEFMPHGNCPAARRIGLSLAACRRKAGLEPGHAIEVVTFRHVSSAEDTADLSP